MVCTHHKPADDDDKPTVGTTFLKQRRNADRVDSRKLRIAIALCPPNEQILSFKGPHWQAVFISYMLPMRPHIMASLSSVFGIFVGNCVRELFTV